MFPGSIESDRLLLKKPSTNFLSGHDLYKYCGRVNEDADKIFEHQNGDPFPNPKESYDFIQDKISEFDRGETAVYMIFSKEVDVDGGDDESYTPIEVLNEIDEYKFDNVRQRVSSERYEFAGMTELDCEWDNRRGNIGLWLREKFWGRGYSQERVEVLFHIGFNLCDFDVIRVETTPDNEKSISSIEKYIEKYNGQYDGKMRNEFVFDDGSIKDSIQWSVTKDQYKKYTNAVTS